MSGDFWLIWVRCQDSQQILLEHKHKRVTVFCEVSKVMGGRMWYFSGDSC